MRITKKEIRQMVPEEDYERGLAYYEQDRVISYREEVTKDLAKLTCKVRGTKLYTVNASFSDRGLSALCTCPRFADRHCCKHLVAALLTMVSYQPETNRSDGRVSRILKAYRDRSRSGVDATRQARLVPQIFPSEMSRGYPTLTFQVGFDRLYVVKNVKTFLEYVSKEEEVTYGKGLTLCHACLLYTSDAADE